MSQVVRITMPDLPPEALKGGEVPKQRAVSVFIDGTRTLWLHSDDLEWMIRFLMLQHQLQKDDESSDAAEMMDFDVTPEKCPQPKKEVTPESARIRKASGHPRLRVDGWEFRGKLVKIFAVVGQGVLLELQCKV